VEIIEPPSIFCNSNPTGAFATSYLATQARFHRIIISKRAVVEFVGKAGIVILDVLHGEIIVHKVLFNGQIGQLGKGHQA